VWIRCEVCVYIDRYVDVCVYIDLYVDVCVYIDLYVDTCRGRLVFKEWVLQRI